MSDGSHRDTRAILDWGFWISDWPVETAEVEARVCTSSLPHFGSSFSPRDRVSAARARREPSAGSRRGAPPSNETVAMDAGGRTILSRFGVPSRRTCFFSYSRPALADELEEFAPAEA